MSTLPSGRRRIVALFVLSVSILASSMSAPALADDGPATTAWYGHSVDSGSDPAVGIEVSVLKKAADGWDLDQTVYTDDRGSYVFLGDTSAVYRLKFHDPSGQLRDQYWKRQTSLADADDVRVGIGYPQGSRVTLSSQNQLAGHVTDEKDQPLDNAYVTLYTKDAQGAWAEYRTAQTEKAGDYMFGGVPDGTYRLSFLSLWGPGYLEKFWGGASDVEHADDLVIEGNRSFDGLGASLDIGGRVTGTVTDTAGQPLPQVPVQLYSETSPGVWTKSRETNTDAQGMYEVGRLRSGRYRAGFSYDDAPYVRAFYGNSDELTTSTNIVVTEGRPTTGVDIRLSAAGSIGAWTAPTVSGSGRVGEPLTVSHGEWTPSDVTLSYRWVSSCDSCAIPGATSAQFVPGPEWVGRSIAVQVMASRKGYRNYHYESSRITVLPADTDSAFEAVGTPQLYGLPTANRQMGVIATPGWSPSPDALTFQWFIDGVPVPGATQPTFTPSPQAAGRRVFVEVTGSKKGRKNAIARSITQTIAPAMFDGIPRLKIRGTAKAGRTLKASPGAWAPQPVSVGYQWLASGRRIPGATRSSFKIPKKYVGKRISLRVSARRTGYYTATTSTRPTAKVKRSR